MDKSLYDIIKKLEKGTGGTVYKAVRKVDQKIVAIKVIPVPYGNSKIFQTVQKEIDYLEQLADPSCNPFVICYGNSYYDTDTKKFYIEMEYIEGKDMEKFINETENNNLEEVVYYYLLLIAKDVTQGLKYIHEKGIIHGDIKPTNIMISNYVPIIVDLGLACEMVENSCKSVGRTPLYTAPEIILNKIRVPKSDLWSLGISLFKLARGDSYPFVLPDRTTAEILYNIITEDEPIKLSTSNEQLNTLVNNLLVKNVNERWSEDDVLNHLEFIEKPNIIINVPKI